MKKLLTIAILIALVAGFSFAGVEWSTRLTSQSTEKRQNYEMTSSLYAQGGDVKQVFENAPKKNDLYVQDGYWLYKGKENMIYIVNDKEKTVMPMSLDSLAQMAGFVGQLVKIEITDHTISAEELGSETILGYPCQHIKIVSDYTMKMKIAFIKKTMTIHEEKEIWGSANIKYFQEVNAAFLKKDFKTGFAQLDEMIEKEMKAQKNIGLPLKMITHTQQKDKKGKVASDTTLTMEMVKIAAGNFPASLFEIPKDYKLVENPMSEEGSGKKKLPIF